MNRIQELIQILNNASNEYYNNSNSIMTDKEFDDLFDELKQLEEETGIIYSNSPTQNVGYEVKSELKKVKHSHPMLSLGKTKDTKELLKFANNQECILSLKMDGLSCLLTFENGELVKAETRGNGEIGEDITHNAKVFENIPLKIPVKEHFEIEGEAIITYDDFNKINNKLSEKDQYKNPRNLASGSVRQLDSSVAKKRHIKFIAWKIPSGFHTYSDGFKAAQEFGFEVVPFFIYNNDNENIEEIIDNLKKKAAILSYPIDGLVMTYNNVEYGKSLGMTGHHPKHSIAYKFYDDEYETTLRSIEWQVGKTGIITPVAVFDEVDIDGTTVSKASVHNVSILTELDLQEGDTITVYKANAIIPQISSNISASERKDTTYIKILGYCPACRGVAVIKQDKNAEVLMCTNPNCKGKLLGKLTHFVSRNAMNIKGLSEATLEKFIELGWLNSLSDIYDLGQYRKRMRYMEGFGTKSIDNLFTNIENSKETTLESFLYSLSINLIGSSASKDISKYCKGNLDKFLEYMNSNFKFSTVIDGFGETMDNSLTETWINNKDEYMKILEHIHIKNNAIEVQESSIGGKVFVITGSVEKFSNRNELKAKIESLGAKVSGSISSKTNYLINNDVNSNSSKNKKAKELGVKIISEDEFLKMIK